MRLIDADELDSVVLRLNTEEKQITRSEYKLIDSVIFEFPTVEAIPIEWIEKWLDEFLGVKLEEERVKGWNYNHMTYVDMVIDEQMKRIRYCREHRDLCSKQILKLLDAFTDEQLEAMLRKRLPEEWDKVIERFRNIEARKVKI